MREAFDKFRGATLQGLFRLCFGRVGGRHTWKKELRKFSGFPFDEKDVQFQRKKAVAQKLAVSEVSVLLCLKFLLSFILQVTHYSNIEFKLMRVLVHVCISVFFDFRCTKFTSAKIIR